MELFIISWPPMNFHWLFCMKTSRISFHLWCMLGGSGWIWMMSNMFCSMRAKLIVVPLGMPKWVGPQCIDIECIFIKPLHQFLQVSTKHLSNMERVAYTTTNSQPKIMLSWRITLMCEMQLHSLHCFQITRNFGRFTTYGNMWYLKHTKHGKWAFDQWGSPLGFVHFTMSL